MVMRKHWAECPVFFIGSEGLIDDESCLREVGQRTAPRHGLTDVNGLGVRGLIGGESCQREEGGSVRFLSPKQPLID